MTPARVEAPVRDSPVWANLGVPDNHGCTRATHHFAGPPTPFSWASDLGLS
ncbi:MAG: hypothetical protein WAR57_15290 [Candidatus Phosphoribacter sp.]